MNETKPQPAPLEVLGVKTKKRIAFDVDGTLIKKTSDGDVPRYEIIQILLTLHALGHTIIVWSGGGEEYARSIVRRLGLTPYCRVMGKSRSFVPDITLDDCEVDLGGVNIIV